MDLVVEEHAEIEELPEFGAAFNKLFLLCMHAYLGMFNVADHSH